MSVTGVLLTFERQMLSWPAGQYQVAPHSPGDLSKSIETAISAAAGRQMPPGREMAPTITVHSSATAPVELSFGRERTVYINPADGKVIGETSGGMRAWFGAIERIHRTLGSEMRQGIGRSITGVCNLAFLFLVVSGFYLWFPKKYSMKHFRPGLWFRGDLKARARALNWHKTIGFWSTIPLFFIVLTGVIMSYTWANNLLYRITGTEPPPPQAEGRGPGRGERAERHGNGGMHHEYPAAEAKSFEDLFATAERSAPGWSSIQFRVPENRDRSVTFSIDRGNGGQPQKRLQLTVNRISGEATRREDFGTYNLGRKLRMIARFLHTGEILGIVGQIIAAAASLGGAFLVYTGLELALRRLARWYGQKQSPVKADGVEPEPLEV